MNDLKDVPTKFPLMVNREGTLVYNKITGNYLNLRENKKGYLGVQTSYNYKRIFCFVHRLVALAFIPNPENKEQVNHKNAVKTDNRVENLEWCSNEENYNHAKDMGIIENRRHNPYKGEESCLSSYSEETVRGICRRLQEGQRPCDVADLFGVSKQLVTDLRKGRAWVHITKEYKFPRKRGTLSEETIKWICHCIAEGRSNKEILQQSTSNITSSHLHSIRSKKCHKDISDEYFR